MIGKPPEISARKHFTKDEKDKMKKILKEYASLPNNRSKWIFIQDFKNKNNVNRSVKSIQVWLANQKYKNGYIIKKQYTAEETRKLKQLYEKYKTLSLKDKNKLILIQEFIDASDNNHSVRKIYNWLSYERIKRKGDRKKRNKFNGI